MYIRFVVRYMRIEDCLQISPLFLLRRNADGGGGGGGGGGKTSRANWTSGETSRIRRNDPDSTGLLCYLMHGLSEDSSRCNR